MSHTQTPAIAEQQAAFHKANLDALSGAKPKVVRKPDYDAATAYLNADMEGHMALGHAWRLDAGKLQIALEQTVA